MGGQYLSQPGHRRKILNINTMEKFTWDDLADAISKLPAEQRTKQVHMSIEDESKFRSVAGIETIQEDVYVNKNDDEDCGDLETLKDAHGNDFDQDDYSLITPKGYPFLWDGDGL